MAEKFENTVLFDYFSFTTKIYDFFSIIKVLGLESIETWSERPGRNYYRVRKYFDGIHIEWDNVSDPDSLHVEMTGQGCRNFETFSSDPDFNRLFQMYIDGDINVTRLDVAFDDFIGVLNLDKMVKQYYAGHFVSKFVSAIHTHELINCRPVPIDKGHSLSFGSVTSDVYFRCYDKRLERQRFDIDHWIRFEMQLRRTAAGEFIKNYMLLDKNVGETFLSCVNNYIRFCKNSDDTNISRWKIAPWWFKFVGDVGKISLYSKKTVEYNLCGVQNYVIGQCGNSIDVMLQTIGQDAFIELIKKRSSELTPKQKHLIEEFHQEQFINGEGVEF